MPGQAICMETSRRIISTPAGEKTKRTGGSEGTASAWRRAWRSGATAHHTTQATRIQKATPGTKFLQGLEDEDVVGKLDQQVENYREGKCGREYWCVGAITAAPALGHCHALHVPGGIMHGDRDAIQGAHGARGKAAGPFGKTWGERGRAGRRTGCGSSFKHRQECGFGTKRVHR